MDSDDSNISDHVGDLDIQSYQFEPLCNDESQQEREHSTSEDSDIDESSQAQDRLVNTDCSPRFLCRLTALIKLLVAVQRPT
jgi:hypothetical protein